MQPGLQPDAINAALEQAGGVLMARQERAAAETLAEWGKAFPTMRS